MIYNPVEVSKKTYFRDFINLPREIYRGNPYWVPPLNLSIIQKLNPKKNPFFKYGQLKLFGVLNEKIRLVARGAAIINPLHNKRYNDKTGFFGFFECVNDIDVARILINRITQELQINDCDKIVGPVNFTTNEECGFLVEGFDSSPVFMTNYCPPYYNELLLGCGFEKEMDLFSYGWSVKHNYPEKFNSLVNILRERGQIYIRPIDRKRLDQELSKIEEVYNTSFKDVWGFVPLTSSELADMGKAFKLIADDDLICFAEFKGKPVGFCLTLPNMNEIFKELNGRLLPFGFLKLLLRRKKISTARIMVLCVIPEYRTYGVAVLLIDYLRNISLKKMYRYGELSVVLESNERMIRLLDSLGFKQIKRYRIYKVNITTDKNIY